MLNTGSLNCEIKYKASGKAESDTRSNKQVRASFTSTGNLSQQMILPKNLPKGHKEYG